MAGLGIIFVLLVVFVKALDYVTLPGEKQCTALHKVSYAPPGKLETAKDYFDLGNYDYDLGRCAKALLDYTKSIELDPTNPQVYNNRAYTFMRFNDYESALPDLDKAIELRPDYVTALMNRGDIYNYYGPKDKQKAIADYNKVISLGKEKDLSGSVCGHKAMAENNNFLPLVLLRLLMRVEC